MTKESPLTPVERHEYFTDISDPNTLNAEDIDAHPSHQPFSLNIHLTAELENMERSDDIESNPNMVHI